MKKEDKKKELEDTMVIDAESPFENPEISDALLENLPDAVPGKDAMTLKEILEQLNKAEIEYRRAEANKLKEEALYKIKCDMAKEALDQTQSETYIKVLKMEEVEGKLTEKARAAHVSVGTQKAKNNYYVVISERDALDNAISDYNIFKGEYYNYIRLERAKRLELLNKAISTGGVLKVMDLTN